MRIPGRASDAAPRTAPRFSLHHTPPPSRCAGAPDVFVTLNPPTPPKPDTVLKRFSLSHPLFTREALAAQATLGGGALQGVGGIWYAGAWCGYGFHEDGIASAVKAVGGLCGGRSVTPWSPVSCAPKMTTRQKIFYSMFARFGARRAIRRSSCAILAQFSRNSLTRHPPPPGGGLLVPGASIRVLLPTGEELFLGDAKASGRDACVLRVMNADMFEKVTLLPCPLGSACTRFTLPHPSFLAS